LGLFLEWWGFISLFYNFTPRFVAQVHSAHRDREWESVRVGGRGGERETCPTLKVDHNLSTLNPLSLAGWYLRRALLQISNTLATH
jgi:hypothetical protein